jgi:hypothetical protein
MEIRELQKKDIKKAIQFAISGMHFELYLKNKTIRNLYGKYFWYLETNRATHLFAAYEGDTLAGVILAEIKGEPRKYYSKRKAFYVKFIDVIQKLFFKDSAGLYDEVNKELFAKYTEKYSPDGEIIFLAANPKVKIKGIGTMLLGELEKCIKGKTIYLFTDNACTYQFYEHRGFDRVGEKDIELDFGDEKVPMTCLLYSKTV